MKMMLEYYQASNKKQVAAVNFISPFHPVTTDYRRPASSQIVIPQEK